MNKRLSKIVLGFVTCTMVVTAIALTFASKDESKVVDIYGNRDELGDVSIVYQQREGVYKTKEIKVTKDNLEVDGFAKELPSGYTMSNFIRENRNLLKYRNSYTDSFYQDDKSIGYVDVYRDYFETRYPDEKIQYKAYVTDKNLDNNKVKEYDIPLDFYDKEDASTDIRVLGVKYNSKLYAVIAYDSDSNYLEGGNVVDETSSDSVYGAKESRISIFKLNLEEESSEHVFTKEIGEEDAITRIANNVNFSYKNTAYILGYRYKVNEENKYDRTISLLGYNIESGKFKNIDLPINIDKNCNVAMHMLDDNILTIIAQSEGDSNYGMTYFYATKINLDTNEIITDGEKYEVKIDDNNDFFSFGINNIRFIDDKIYLTIGSYEDKEVTKSIGFTDKRYVVVLDEKSKETLYIGKLTENIGGYINPTIVIKDEL